MKIRKGDTVLVIAGKDKGKEGTVDRVLPKENKVVVTGINTAVRHQRPLRANEQGGRIDKDADRCFERHARSQGQASARWISHRV